MFIFIIIKTILKTKDGDVHIDPYKLYYHGIISKEYIKMQYRLYKKYKKLLFLLIKEIKSL